MVLNVCRFCIITRKSRLDDVAAGILSGKLDMNMSDTHACTLHNYYSLTYARFYCDVMLAPYMLGPGLSVCLSVCHKPVFSVLSVSRPRC